MVDTNYLKKQVIWGRPVSINYLPPPLPKKGWRCKAKIAQIKRRAPALGCSAPVLPSPFLLLFHPPSSF